MTYQSHGYTLDDAIARSEEIYEVDFNNWGIYDPSVPFTMPQIGMQFPPPGQRGLPASLAGISIGPRSEVDRVWVSWDRQKPLNRPTSEAEAADFISPSRIVTVDAPLLFQQRGRDGQIDPAAQSINEALQKGLLYAFPFATSDSENGSTGADAPPGGTTVSPASWLNQFGVVQTESPFSGIIGNGGIPRLQLILHLRPLAFAPPAKRGPLVRNSAWLNPSGTRQLNMVVPIFGRKHVDIQMVSSAFGAGGPAAVTDFYVGLIRGTRRTLSLASAPVFETNVFTSLATPVDKPVTFSISNPNADWLMFWTDPAGLAPSNGGVTVVAID
jgi:hypothetical protein